MKKITSTGFQVKVWSQHRAAMLWPWDFVKLSLFQVWLERRTRGWGGVVGGGPICIPTKGGYLVWNIARY